MKRLFGWMRARPLTVAAVALVLAANILVRLWDMTAGTDLLTALAHTGVDRVRSGDVVSILVSFVFDAGWPLLVGHLLLLVVVLGLAEPRLGAARTAVAAVLSGVGGVALGMAIAAFGASRAELWATAVADEVSVSMAVPLLGVLMASASFMGVLWRRRIHVVAYAVVITLLLFIADPVDLYALFSIAIGHALGRFWSRGRHRSDLRRSSHHEARALLSLTVALMAVGPLLTVFSSLRLGPLAPLGLLLSDEGTVDSDRLAECLGEAISSQCLHEFTLQRVSTPGGIAVSLLPTLIMLVAAYGISKGRRVAAWVAIGMNAAISLLSLWYFVIGPFGLQGLDLTHRVHLQGELGIALLASGLAPLGVVAVLVAGLRHVQLPARPHQVRRGLIVVLVTGLGLAVLYVAVGLSVPAGFTTAPTLGQLVADLPERFIPVGFLRLTSPGFLPASLPTALVYEWIGPVFSVVVLAVLVHLLQVVPPREERSARHEVDRLLLLGGQSLSFMATWPGNLYWFSSTGRVGIAYRVSHGIALTVGDPFGDPHEADEAVFEFVRFCDDRALTPVFYSVHEQCRDLLCSREWQSFAVGLESVIDPRAWQTRGKRWQDVRTAINRARRDGVHDTLTTFADASLAVQLQIAALSEQWVSEKALPEMGFTLGGLEQLHDRRVRMLIAQDEHGQLQAVTSWLPTCRDGRVVGWTLDFMRRRPDSPNGVMEFLIARMAERLQEEGEAEFMSLSAAPLAGLDSAPATAISGLLTYLSHTLEPVYGFRSLFLFKRKFQPQEVPIHIVYADAAALSNIGLAVAHAYLPDVRPRDLAHLLRSEEQRSSRL